VLKSQILQQVDVGSVRLIDPFLAGGAGRDSRDRPKGKQFFLTTAINCN